MKKAKERIEFEHYSEYIANLNAIGNSFAKNYKYQNIFKGENKKATVTDEEKEEMRRLLEAW